MRRRIFQAGSAVVKSVDRNLGIIHITPQVRSKRGWPCWWYLKVDGAKEGQPVTLSLTAADGEFRRGRVLSADWSQPDRAAISADNVTWTQTPKCQKANGTATYSIEAPAESFWMAWGPPFLPSHADVVLKSIKSRLPDATVFELARTRGGRSVRGIRIGGNADSGSPGHGVWVQARQHAWEAGASWVGRGFIEWLASDDPSAVNLRRVATVYYVPIMDVDNAAVGAGGKDAVPRDHNRDWDDKPHYPEVAAAGHGTDKNRAVFATVHRLRSWFVEHQQPARIRLLLRSVRRKAGRSECSRVCSHGQRLARESRTRNTRPEDSR